MSRMIMEIFGIVDSFLGRLLVVIVLISSLSAGYWTWTILGQFDYLILARLCAAVIAVIATAIITWICIRLAKFFGSGFL